MLHLELFITAKLAAGLTPKTIAWYEWMLGVYAKFCAGEGNDPHKAETVERFLAHMRRLGAAPSSVSSYYRALHAYFAWLARRSYLENNPLKAVDKPRVPRRRAKRITPAEFNRLYASITGAEWIDHRDRAILVILFYSGLRVSEAINLQLGDIDTVRRVITVRSGKGGHERDVPCAPHLREPLAAYLYSRPAHKQAALWLSNDGAGGVRGALQADGIRLMLRRRCLAAGLRYYNPHAFRHGFATSLLNAGMNLSAVSAALGHSSVVITEQVYAEWLIDG
ncbi:MAG: tyrosine-type recombinase/integrase, partial [Chloroflexota bacterium]|nr:tyrosine-type recombinase/integrase [Chloroflexota bacterium]